ncbi:MAG: hypothetical protein AB2L20_02315 [Mangrovibacterium sp.]
MTTTDNLKRARQTTVHIQSPFSGKLSKGIVDIILLICLLTCLHSSSAFKEGMEQVRNGGSYESVFAWGMLHCLSGLVFICFMAIHVGQRLNFYKALIRKKLYMKNKLATFVSISFMFLAISILLFLTGFNESTMHFHLLFAHLFAITVIIHAVTRLRQFVLLFRGNRNSTHKRDN